MRPRTLFITPTAIKKPQKNASLSFFCKVRVLLHSMADAPSQQSSARHDLQSSMPDRKSD
jgi:hypothetical protein